MASATDVLRAKTDAELQFFIDNPSYYHTDLVAAARQELRRRGVGPAPAAAAPIPYTTDYEEEAPSNKRPLLIGGGLLVLAAAGAGIFWVSQKPAAVPLAAQLPSHLSPDSLKLETVATQALPTFDTDKIIVTQLGRIPAGEKKKAQAMRQFKELCRRFWTAETQTEFLTDQAHAGKAGPMFGEQALLVRDTWRAWNKAVVYSYAFGPVMSDQLSRMSKAASSQQHVLANLPGLLPNRAFLTDKEMNARDNEVQDWLAGVVRVSPVTGRPYKTTVLQFRP